MIKNDNPLKEKIADFEAVIFDLDGTLVDSMWIWEDIDIAYLGRFDIVPPRDLQTDIEGMSFSETAVYFKERFGLPDSLDKMKADWIAMACDKYLYEIPYKKGAEQFLKHCRTCGIKLGVATSNSRELVESAAKALSFETYFSCIMTACEVKKGKPASDIYLAVAKKLDVKPEKCLVFEDILPGIRAGIAAGMKVCAVEDKYSAGIRKKKQELADYYIEDYEELL